MKRVLVLCTGNSCRSVMAEAIINSAGEGKYHAVSAGSFPTGYVHPHSLETLARHHVEFGQPRSKSWDEFAGHAFSIVLTVCDEAANELCPLFLGDYQKMHWSIPDPAKIQGSQADIQRAFDTAFSLIKRRVQTELL